MQSFEYKGLPAHVVFGRGSLDQLGRLISEVGGTRALIITTPQQAEQAAEIIKKLGDVAVASFEGAIMHTPTDVTEKAVLMAGEAGSDVTVAFGGGSTIGLAKAIALRTGIPQVAVPTTYAGSEMTPILGQTENGVKTTLRSLAVLPRAVLYDVDLTMGLPQGLSGTSGINAIAHAVEGLYALDNNPVMSLIAEEGIRALAASLPMIVKNGRDFEARTEAQYGAWLCGMVLGVVGMALHHKLCHTLGGSFNLPHAETHAVVLPHTVAYNAPATSQAMARVRRALGGVENPATALYDLARVVGAPAGLHELGMPREGVAIAVREALENPYWNPRVLEPGRIEALIANAWKGDRPT